MRTRRATRVAGEREYEIRVLVGYSREFGFYSKGSKEAFEGLKRDVNDSAQASPLG